MGFMQEAAECVARTPSQNVGKRQHGVTCLALNHQGESSLCHAACTPIPGNQPFRLSLKGLSVSSSSICSINHSCLLHGPHMSAPLSAAHIPDRG